MPAIAEQVATIEHDLQEALARVDSLTEEKEVLRKALTAVTVEKSDLEAKYNDQQSLVDETREMVDKLANMSLTMLRTSRRKVGAPQSNGTELKDVSTQSDSAAQTDAAPAQGPDFAGENAGLKLVLRPEAMTSAERLRADLLFDTAAGALEIRSPRAKLPDGLPMFLHQPKNPPPGTRRARVME